ncbi:MAG: ribosome assembly RNA-binding protein YhbY [Proteobacteria bacterium]|nr:ribosome assembly RNA-binding protein YhbY [Pseudomonadota bacterium]MCH9711275.1 ribosome assembly RNA-binding protein YhbY [Pseudomonadota bacterium]MCH9749602.1 ribosome assembly RNA-binding protein YhbY [Pseudomonadota bacterium]
MKLTNNQKKFLRSKGHSLKPVVMMGQHGLTEGVLAELDSSLETHELLKIKVRGDDREDKQRIIDEILQKTQAHLVQVIGNVMVIYRAFDENPQLILPRK